MVDSILTRVDCGGIAVEGGVVIGRTLVRILIKVSV